MIFFARWTPAIYWSLVSKPVSQDIQSICYCLHTGIFRLDTCDLVVAGVPISISSKYLYLYLALKVLTIGAKIKHVLRAIIDILQQHMVTISSMSNPWACRLVSLASSYLIKFQ